jgi:NADH:ubiquinone oxidoreductase subunit 6 (subunit J)
MNINCPNCDQKIELVEPPAPRLSVDGLKIEANANWVGGFSILLFVAAIIVLVIIVIVFINTGVFEDKPSDCTLAAEWAAGLILSSILVGILVQLLHIRASLEK